MSVRLSALRVCLVLLLLAAFVACSSDDATRADASDGDTSDGDASDGDTSDGDLTDGDVPGDADLPSDGDLDRAGETDVEAEDDAEEELPVCAGSCVYGEDLPDCLSETELCWCDEDLHTFSIIDCHAICETNFYDGGGICGFDDAVNHERCLCGHCEDYCCSNADCQKRGSDYCVGDIDSEGIQNWICMDACDLAMCDPGTDSIPCIDYGTPSQPFGVCFDPEGPDCDTPDDFCGGDENHICMAFQNGDQICMEICEPIPNTCNEDTLCIPMEDGITIFGGCLEL